VRTEF
jgi:hypothetical protein